MSKKQPLKSNRKQVKRKDSVFSEAWENMSEDMSRVMPEFLIKHTQRGKKKLWVVVALTILELIVLGVVGKLFYDWFTS